MEDNKEKINIEFREAIEKAILNPAQKTFPEIENCLNQGADINSKIRIKIHGSYEETPLIHAVKILNKNLFNFLLQKNADIDAYGSWGETPLSIIILKNKIGKLNSNNELFNIEEDFLKHGADPNKKGINGDTIFTHAARFGTKDLVKLLIKYNAKINEKDNYHITAYNYHILTAYNESPLKAAISKKNFEVIQELCNLGASLTDIDSNSSNVFYAAIKQKFSQEHINFFIINSRFDSYDKNVDEQLKNSIKTILLAFNRLNLKFPKEIPFIIFSYLALNSLHGFNKKLCQQLINNKNAKDPLLAFTYNHVDNLEQILQSKNKQGQTALQLLHDEHQNDLDYIREVESLVDVKTLQQDRIDFMNGSVQGDNLVAQIYKQSEKLLLEK